MCYRAPDFRHPHIPTGYGQRLFLVLCGGAVLFFCDAVVSTLRPLL